MKRILLTAIIASLLHTAHAQVTGIMMDTAKKPVSLVSVGIVLKSNPSDTQYVFTNDKGVFEFQVVPSSSFSIVFINSNYEAFAKFIPVTKQEKTINLGILTAKESIRTLKEVVVQAPPIVIKEDTIEYNAASFKVKENAVVEDLLKKLPGIEVDRKTGDVKAQGKQVTRVKVNGKEFFGGDVQTATKELPANMVDKIQVIDDYGDQATVSGIKDGDPEKVLNIQLKKDQNKGFFGRATVGAGTEERYQASFNGNYFNGNSQVSLFANSNNTGQSLFNFGGGGNRGTTSMMRIGSGAMNDMGGMSGIMNAIQSGDQGFLSGGGNNSGITSTNSIGTNYRDQWGKRVTVYGSYSYTHRNNNRLQNTSSQNFFQGGSFDKIQDDNSITKSDNHRFTFNLEWQADSFNYFKFTPTISYGETNTNALTNFINTDGSSKLTTSKGFNKNNNLSQTPNFNGSILFNHKFRKRGRNFSASANMGNSRSESDQVVRSLTDIYSPAFTVFQNQNIIQDNNNHNYGVRLTYTEPINKFRSIDFTASHNLNYARNNKATYAVDTLTNAKNFIQILSNDFENNFYNNRLGVSVRTTKKKYNYSLGVSVLPVDLQGRSLTKDSAYKPVKRVNVFPIARFAYNFSRSKTFNFNYQGNATQPTFSQLQDVLDISNQQSFTRGNPNLKPAINHNLNLSYNNFNIMSGKVIFTNLLFSTIQNQIVNNTVRRGNGLQSTMPENVNGYYNVNGFFTFSKPFQNRKYVISLNSTANFNHNINLIDSIRTIGKNWLLSQGVNFEFNHKEWLEFGLGVNYSLNDIKYDNKGSISSLQNTSSNAITLSSNINIDIPKDWVLKYDFDYTINNGLSSSITQNPAIMNASLEKQLFKKKNGILRIAAFDLFKQQTNINRSASANSIIDTRTNRLTRYFMLTFQYRLQKFTGQRPQNAREIRVGGPTF